MTPRLFVDNTVLVNFAIVQEMPLLGEILTGSGSWSASVLSECLESSKRPGLETLDAAGAILGEPLFPLPVEHVDARVIHGYLAVPGDGPDAHLGECESLAIIRNRYPKAVFVTDDNSVLRLAAPKPEGSGAFDLRCKISTTWGLLSSGYRRNIISGTQLWTIVETMRLNGRWLPSGIPNDRNAFLDWVSR